MTRTTAALSGTLRPCGKNPALSLIAWSVLLAGCGAAPVRTRAEGQPPAAPDQAAMLAADVQRVHGQAAAVTADLLVRVKPAGADAEIFQLHLWCAEDGRIHLEATRLEVPFIRGLVQADGHFTAELVQSREVVHGVLADLAGHDAQGRPLGLPFLTWLTLLVSEAKAGPLPTGPAATSPAADTLRFSDPASGLAAVLTVDHASHHALDKRLVDATGAPVLTLEYGKYQAFDLLNRASRVKLVVAGDAGEYSLRLRELRAVPAISDEGMRFAPPAGLTEITPAEFLQRLEPESPTGAGKP
jgi:hypothetical protein